MCQAGQRARGWRLVAGPVHPADEPACVRRAKLRSPTIVMTIMRDNCQFANPYR